MSASQCRKQRRKAERENPGAQQQPEQPQRSESIQRSRWLSLSEVAERLGVCPRTLRNWEKKGVFELRRLGMGGRLVGLTQGDLDDWIASNLTFGGESA
jgi:predicted DNA-binding transcriptional regulator AlpA